MEGDSRRLRRARRRRPADPGAEPWFRLPPAPTGDGPVLILGAGLAGCHLAASLAARAQDVILLERGPSVAVGASGNPAAVAKPFVTRAPSDAGEFLAAAHDQLRERLAMGRLAALAGYRRCGALQLTESPYPAHARYRVLDAADASAEAGTPLPSGALAFDDAGWLDPAALCRALVDDALSDGAQLALDADIRTIEAPGGRHGWRLVAQDGRRWEGRALVLANGTAVAATDWTRDLPLLPARGQISRFALRRSDSAPRCVVAGRRYAIPDGETLYVGATFERGVDDASARTSDDAANLAGLRALLPGVAVRPEPVSSHAGVRASTPDRMPIVGPVPDFAACRALYADLSRGRDPQAYPPAPCVPGLAVSGGFGSRGVVGAPLAAALLADWLDGGDALQRWTPQLHPLRFAIRTARRG